MMETILSENGILVVARDRTEYALVAGRFHNHWISIKGYTLAIGFQGNRGGTIRATVDLVAGMDGLFGSPLPPVRRESGFAVLSHPLPRRKPGAELRLFFDRWELHRLSLKLENALEIWTERFKLPGLQMGNDWRPTEMVPEDYYAL